MGIMWEHPLPWSLMTRRQKDSLRPLTDQERHDLERLSRAQAEPSAVVARAKALLAVAGGQSFTEWRRSAGRRSGDALSVWGGKRKARRQRARAKRHALGGSGAYTRRPLLRRGAA